MTSDMTEGITAQTSGNISACRVPAGWGICGHKLSILCLKILTEGLALFSKFWRGRGPKNLSPRTEVVLSLAAGCLIYTYCTYTNHRTLVSTLVLYQCLGRSTKPCGRKQGSETEIISQMPGIF